MPCRCLSWEQWEEETWTDGVTLGVTLEGGNLVNIEQTPWDSAQSFCYGRYIHMDTCIPPLGKSRLVRARANVCEGIHTKGNLCKLFTLCTVSIYKYISMYP